MDIKSLNNNQDSKEVEKYVFKGVTVWVSKDGFIYNDKGIRLNEHPNMDGYPTVNIYLPYRKNTTSITVHRLVALTYLPYPNDGKKYEVNHKDYDRTNYNLDNLEWITHKENVHYSICNRPDMSGVNNPNYGNRKLSKIYAENPEYAAEKQSRPGIQNGRCQKVLLYRLDECLGEFEYKAQALEFMNKKEGWGQQVENTRACFNQAMRKHRLYKGLYRTENI